LDVSSRGTPVIVIPRGTLQDRPDSFGWISIALHWLTAVLITALWIIGRSIEFQAVDSIDARRSLHVTLGLAAWLLLAARIAWRLKNPHPRAFGQSELIHRVARATHYLMLMLLAIMLVSGPLLAWSSSTLPAMAAGIHSVHGAGANLLLLLVVIHVAGALKHLMFNDDETIARIFVPRR
jgi:cytochrome b561